MSKKGGKIVRRNTVSEILKSIKEFLTLRVEPVNVLGQEKLSRNAQILKTDISILGISKL